MPREWYINGETLVVVKGGAHLSGSVLGTLTELGLSDRDQPVVITPDIKTFKVHTDDFGLEVEAEVLRMLCTASVRMRLIHYDHECLRACIGESVGMISPIGSDIFLDYAPVLTGAGTPMGRNKQVFSSGCHYISLNIFSEVQEIPWRFYASYLTEFRFPLGSDRSVVDLSWRVIPYTRHVSGEILSSGVILWDYVLDADPDLVNGGVGPPGGGAGGIGGGAPRIPEDEDEE